MLGIDISYLQDSIDWGAVKRSDVSFAIVKASQGKLISDARVGPFEDPRFKANIKGASDAMLDVGVYHYLCAGSATEALREAEYFIRLITPYKSKINLWAVCDCEEDMYLPTTKAGITMVVKTFLDRVAKAGFKPMLYSNPNYLTYKLNDVSEYPLWLAYWGASEKSALKYKPLIWQYGTSRVNGIYGKVDSNKGYFTVQQKPEDKIRPGAKVKVLRPYIYGTQKKFTCYFPVYDVISVSGDRVVIGIGKAVTAAVRAEDLQCVS